MSVLHRVRAHNLATTSTNKIHDDEVARRYGFSGGLVPGVDVYAYMTNAILSALGRVWLSDGSVQVRFHQPVYDSRWVTIEKMEPETVTDDGASNLRIDLVVRDDANDQCATATARTGAGAPPVVAEYPVVPLPDPPPPASAETLRAGNALGRVDTRFSSREAGEYLDAIGETLPLYRDEGIAHPGWLLRRANRILAANVVLGPWIHVGSAVRYFGVVGDGAEVSTRARVVKVWERHEHKFVTLGVLVLTGDDRPVMQAEHTAIYEPRPRR